MAEIWAAVWAGSMTALGPGLLGATKGRWDSVLNTTGVTVRAKRPRRPLPRCDWMDAALALSFRCTRRMDSYVGLPMIGWIVGLGKLSTIFSVDGIVVILA